MNIFHNNLFLLSVRIISKLITIFVLSFVARNLGVNNFGIYGTIVTFCSFTGIISDFGLVIPNIRTISKNELTISNLINDSLYSKLINSFVGLFLIIIIGIIFKFPMELIFIFGISSIFEVTSINFIRYFEGLQNFKLLSLLILFERVMFAVSVLIPIYYFNSIISIGIGNILWYLILLILTTYYFNKKFGKIKLIFDKAKIKKYFIEGLPFSIMIFFSALFYKSDLLIINHFLGSEKSGIYNVVLRVFDSQMFIPVTITSTLYPVFIKLYSEDKIKFNVFIKKYFILISLIGLIVSVLIYFFAENIVLILFSEKYIDSIHILKIFSLIYVINYLNTYLSYILFSMHKEKYYTIILAIVTLLSIIINYLFVKDYGIIFSTYVRLVIEVLLFVGILISIYKINYSKNVAVS